MSGWDDDAVETLARLWNDEGLSASQIARRMGKTRNAIIGKSRRLNLHYRAGNALTLNGEHSAIIEGRTLFPTRVVSPSLQVLKPGTYQRKLGPEVKKGRWKGMPIFSLTLEERATCPRSCARWSDCYGNGMHNAVRYQHGYELERELARELAILQHKHMRGFVVRLHILGDFYSIPYVHFWGNALAAFPALRIFGYTHHQVGHRIGDAIAEIRREFRQRFSIRHSDAYSGYRTAVINNEKEARGRIVCPAQTGRTKNCGTCGLCWQTMKPIAFLRH